MIETLGTILAIAIIVMVFGIIFNIGNMRSWPAMIRAKFKR